jgi:Mor family transcriptional regulator
MSLLLDIHQVIANELAQVVEPDTANSAASKVVEVLIEQFGTSSVHIPTRSPLARQHRNLQIQQAYTNGIAISIIANDHGISERSVHRIIREFKHD